MAALFHSTARRIPLRSSDWYHRSRRRPRRRPRNLHLEVTTRVSVEMIENKLRELEAQAVLLDPKTGNRIAAADPRRDCYAIAY